MYDILITGGSGFIGNGLLEKFKKKKIILVVRENSKINVKDVKILKYRNFSDLTSKLKNIKTKTVIHCATHYVKEHQLNDIEQMIKANVLLGSIILELSKKMKVSKFINITTIWELTLINSIKQVSFYSLTKNIFSKIIKFYSTNYKKIKFYNLYLSDTFGDNDKREKILNVIKKKIYKKEEIVINSKYLKMNFLNIKDVVNAVSLVEVNNRLKSGKYLVCNKKNFEISKIINDYNLLNKKKINYKFENEKKINTKIPAIPILPNWKIKHSSISDIINFLKK
jgi:nucleoside-diphosphate-sugar epimerase